MNNIESIKALLEKRSISYLENEPLARHSSFKVGGSAALFVKPTTADDLIYTARLANEYSVKFRTIGNASNILFSDNGYDGIILLSSGYNKIEVNDSVIYAAGGASYTKLSSYAGDIGLGGLEFAYGIPGTVGGAVYMNAGAYGKETSSVLLSVDAYDVENDKCICLDRSECKFGYRNSIFIENRKLIILGARFGLTTGSREEIKAQMNELMARRRAGQPLEYPSAGSTFKRPTGHFAGKLIEDCGLKGCAIGGAQVSEKHAGFIINKSNATADDVLELIQFVKKKVNDSFGVMLECEIEYID